MANQAPVRPTRSVVVPAKRKIPGNRPEDVTLDCSVEDFVKWVLLFGKHNSGHFVSNEACMAFAAGLGNHIVNTGGYVSKDHMTGLLAYITQHGTAFPGIFTCQEAANDLARQVMTYVEVDGHIGKVPNGTSKLPGAGAGPASDAGTSEGGRRRKTAGQSGKSRSSVSRRSKRTGQG